MAVTDFSWASMTPATNCWPPFSAFACARGVVVAVAVRAVRAAAGLRLRDFEAVRLREDAAVLRVRGFAAVLARGFGFGLDFGLAVALAGVGAAAWRVGVGVVALAGVGVVALAGVGVVAFGFGDWADVVSFGDSAGFASVCFGAVSVAMLGSSVSGA